MNIFSSLKSLLTVDLYRNYLLISKCTLNQFFLQWFPAFSSWMAIKWTDSCLGSRLNSWNHLLQSILITIIISYRNTLRINFSGPIVAVLVHFFVSLCLIGLDITKSYWYINHAITILLYSVWLVVIELFYFINILMLIEFILDFNWILIGFWLNMLNYTDQFEHWRQLIVILVINCS